MSEPAPTTATLNRVGTLRQRATIDVVIIILAVVVAIAILASVVGIIVLEIANPDADTTAYINLIDAQISVIVGALVGLIAGQASARARQAGAAHM